MSSSELDLMAASYLESLEKHEEFEGGILLGDSLHALPLDYSLESLDALDGLFIQASRTFVADHMDLGDPEVQNLSFLAAFYVGEVLARARGLRPTWKLYSEIAEGDPSFERVFPYTFETYIVCCLGRDRFMPMVAIRHLLELGESSPKRLRTSVEAFL